MVPGMSRRVFRINLTAFVTDFALYLVWTAIPFKAIGLGATPAELGLLPAIASSTYVLTTVFAGRLSDKLSRLLLARLGCVVFAGGCLLVLRAPSVVQILPVLPLVGLGMGFFWPPIQAALADEGNVRSLEKNIGLFNVFWSTGKAMGFLVAGSLYARSGAGPILLLASAVMLVMMLVIPRKRAEVPDELDDERAEFKQIRSGDLRAFLHMAWLANAIAFGVGHTLNTQYPKLMVEIGLGSGSFGVYLSLIFLVQTLAFLLLRTYQGWKFRRLPAYTIQGAMGVAVVLVSFARPLPLILLSALPLGLSLGLAYHASITYSLAGHVGRGHRAGIHESLLGAGNLLIPLTGGLLASALGNLRLPYWFCGVVVLVGLLAQETIWRRRGRDGSPADRG